MHLPYSSSLEKECRNAADIVGNFFRGKWGADADQSIPISFLEKAHGLALMSIVRAGFLVSAKVGTSFVVVVVVCDNCGFVCFKMSSSESYSGICIHIAIQLRS